jgi:beta-galactosidase
MAKQSIVARLLLEFEPFDAEQGFFLNGKHLKLQDTNNHQDHAGVGTAMPDELQYFRIKN